MSSREHFSGSPDGGALTPAGPEADRDQELELALYREMLVVRGVELAIENMHKLGRMSGSFHSSLGQEACAVGVCSALRPTDIVTSTHRGHGHALAKGVPIRSLFAELLGRRTGASGGRGGSMHLHNRESGFYGETAIVGGGVAWAAGAAWARKRRGRDDVAAAFIGDGAFAQGSPTRPCFSRGTGRARASSCARTTVSPTRCPRRRSSASTVRSRRWSQEGE